MEPNPTLNYMGTITIVSIFQATGKHYNLLKYAGYVGNMEGNTPGMWAMWKEICRVCGQCGRLHEWTPQATLSSLVGSELWIRS